jgi:hypothetical protein
MTSDQPIAAQTQEVCVQTPPPALLAKKVTRKNLARVQEKHLLRNIDALMATMFPALIQKLKEGNLQAIRLTAELANLVKAPGGVTISQTILQANSNSADGGAKFSFDALARKLDGRDSSASAVIDVTPE